MTARKGAAEPWWWAAIAAAAILLAAGFLATRPPTAGPSAPTPPIAAQPQPGDGRIRVSPGHELLVDLPGGPQERVTSMLAVTGPMRFGEFVWNDRGVPPGRTWVRVDLDRQLVSVFRSGEEIGTAVILYGANNAPTPLGWHQVIARERDHYSRTYDAPMPYMLQLTPDGVALHASVVREGRATHGCIGLPYAFAAKLFDAMRKGDAVLVLGSPRNAGLTAS